jgi:hypothetical protein
MMCKSLEGWHDFDFQRDLADRDVGPSRLPYYPYRDDAQLWWDAIRDFVNGVVDITYSDDDAVTNDSQLQAWGRVLAAKRTRRENGAELIPAPPDTKVALAALLQKIIFTCTAYHAAVQIPLNGFDVSPLTAPCSLYPDAETAPPESMMANLGTSLFQLAFFYFGDIVTHEVGSYFAKRRMPNRLKAPTDLFTSRLPQIEQHIAQANAGRTIGAYNSLLPQYVSRSVDI